MHNLLQDVRYAVRVLLKTPGFTLVAVITLALGIGANTAVFSIVKGLAFQFPPVPKPSKLVRLWAMNRAIGTRTQMSVPDYLDVRRQNRSFSRMAAWTSASWLLGGAGETARVEGAQVSADFFRVLGVEPKTGRNFTAQEDQPGAAPVAIISDGLWKRAFSADAAVVGRSVRLDDQTYTVIGIMPPGFWYQSRYIDVWTPLVAPAAGWNRAQRSFSAFGRLRPGVKSEQARAELDLIAARLEREHPESNTGWQFTPVTLWDEQMKRVGAGMALFFAPAIFVLLIACANVGNMMLARAAVRSTEIAVRVALGASRGRVLRQLLTECGLLSLTGAAAGVALGFAGMRMFLAMLPAAEGARAASEIHFDISVFAFGLLAAAATTAIFGLSPALQATRLELNAALKERESGTRLTVAKRRSSDRLVALEIMLALIFLVITALAVRGVQRIERAMSQPGFDGRNVISFDISPRDKRYVSDDQVLAYYRDLQERVAAVPGVQATGATSFLPLLRGREKSTPVALEPASTVAKPYAAVAFVLPGYLETMHIPVVRGRAIAPLDARGAMPVACVSESFARRYWPGQDAIGKQVKLAGDKSGWLTIVGVVGDVLDNPVTGRQQPSVYLPQAQSPVRQMIFTVRVPSASPEMMASVKNAVWAFDRDQELYFVATVQQQLDDEARGPWFAVGIMGTFALLGLVLASVGVYGVMSYVVAQRTREVGLRMAMGASPRRILLSLLRRGALLIAAGAGFGLVIAVVAGRFMLAELGPLPADPSPYLIAVGALAAAALLGTYIPARRASKVDPMVALRSE